MSITEKCFANTVDSDTIAQTGGYIDTTVPKTAYIFLGDSRFVGMNIYAHITNFPDVFVVAEVAKGYDWLDKVALNEIQKIKDTTDYDKYIIICNMGVNDLGNINKYISILPRLYAEDTDLYWVSVNPTIDSLTRVKCSSIENFNITLKQYIPEMNWIDTYTYLQTTGFKARDGLHYDSETYGKLFYYIMSYVITMEYWRNMVILDSQK